MNIYPSDYDDDRPEAPWNDAAQDAADREWSEHLDAIGDPAAERIDAHLDEQDAAADWQPVDADLVEIFGAQVAAGIEADYQRRRAAHDEMIERHRREFEEWQRREKADREWMKTAGFWPVWPEDEDEVAA